MITSSSWAFQYLTVALVALFAGPILSKLPIAESFPLTVLGLNGPQTIRLLIEETGLVILCVLAIRAFQHIPHDGHGGSFLRQLVLPVTTLFIVIVTDKTLRVAGAALIEQIGSSRYTLTYTAALILTGLWISTAWLLNLDALHRFFSNPHPSSARKTSRLTDVEDERDPEEATALPTATPISITPSSPPQVLGRYKVLKELGRGSMGIVYLGKDPTIQRFVAIKTMKFDEVDEANDIDKVQEIRSRFFREAESTGRLSHPNIVTIFDAGEEQGLGYIAMEMLQGTTLQQWTRKPNLLPLEKLVPILSTVAEAMDYAHQQGIVHRDIKPANIMLTTDDVVKIMDFGIAKIGTSSKTQTDLVLGTPVYMSPEQIAGKKVDGRSDIFSLGVVMFELLTGRPPFLADNVSALLFAIAHTPHTSVKALRPDLSPRLKNVIDQALQKDPVHRYRRASDFAVALRSCLEELAA